MDDLLERLRMHAAYHPAGNEVEKQRRADFAQAADTIALLAAALEGLVSVLPYPADDSDRATWPADSPLGRLAVARDALREVGRG